MSAALLRPMGEGVRDQPKEGNEMKALIVGISVLAGLGGGVSQAYAAHAMPCSEMTAEYNNYNYNGANCVMETLVSGQYYGTNQITCFRYGSTGFEMVTYQWHVEAFLPVSCETLVIPLDPN